MPGDYEVGYKKPPRHARFAKGRSGNPRGRPKDTKNLKTDLAEELREQVLVREGATQKQLSKQRAMLKSLTTKAIKGDTRAANIVLTMILRLIEAEEGEKTDVPLTADERAILQTFEHRLLRKAQRRGKTRPDGIPQHSGSSPDSQDTHGGESTR